MNKKIKYFVGIYILFTSSLYAQNTVFIDNIVDIWHWLVLLIIIIFHYIYLKIFAINKFTTAIYTMKGAKIKNHLNGFSQFISRITTDEVEKKLKYDPLYLDKYLPYAIMFGHTKYWLSFYTKLDIESPSWYLGKLDKISELIDNISYNISDSRD